MSCRAQTLVLAALVAAAGCGGDDGDQGPDISLAASPTAGVAPLNVLVEWQVSDPQDDPLKVSLDLDNGSPLQDNLPASGSLQHVYADPGSYTVRMTAADDNGHTADESITISVSTPGQGTLTVLDASGREIDQISEEARASLLARLTGLTSGGMIELMLYRDGQPLYQDGSGQPRPLLLTANALGRIPLTALFYDLGVDPATGAPAPAAGSYTVQATGEDLDLFADFTVSGPGRGRQALVPIVWVQRTSERYARGSVPLGEEVFANGAGFPPNRSVRLHVVTDRNGWQEDELLQDVTGLVEHTRTDSQGRFTAAVRVWSEARPVGGTRDFDLVAEVADEQGGFDSRFTPGVDAVDADLITGFTVQAPTQSGLRLDLAADAEGNYSNRFTTLQSVYLWVNPPRLPPFPTEMVRKYICAHQDIWRTGDPLVDVTAGVEVDLVRRACSNQLITAAWIPPLEPGIYSPVIDVNQNGVYDTVDLLGTPIEVTGFAPD